MGGAEVLSELLRVEDRHAELTVLEEAETKYDISKEESIEDIIAKLTDEMLKHAASMEFEKAAELRDKIKELENVI